MADAATSQFERADLLDVAQRWLSLARSSQLCSHWGEMKQQGAVKELADAF
jgi:hypothetical protein